MTDPKHEEKCPQRERSCLCCPCLCPIVLEDEEFEEFVKTLTPPPYEDLKKEGEALMKEIERRTRPMKIRLLDPGCKGRTRCRPPCTGCDECSMRKLKERETP